MPQITELPFETEELNPANYPELVGPAGPATEWRTSATHLQARPVGGDTWTDVVALSEITGADGAQGEPGLDGQDGADGKTILSASGAPSDALGTDGDYALDLAAALIYGPKAAGTWPEGVSIKGADGEDGAAADLTPIPEYTETGATLTPVAGVLTIPLDGKIYTVTLTANVTSVVTTAPTAPECGSAVVYVNQDATGNRSFPYPATWRWPGKAVTAITLTANAQSELLLNSTPAGNIIARVTPNIGVVA